MQKKHRVLIIDDSAVARVMMTRGLGAHPGIEVVDAVPSARLNLLNEDILKLDIVVLDVDASKITQDDLARLLAPIKHTPVILTSYQEFKGVGLMGRGVVGYVQKPAQPSETDNFLKKMSSKIVLTAVGGTPASQKLANANVSAIPVLGNKPALDDTIIALGASTGGTEATLEVLKSLPPDLPPMVIVQHMPAGFTKMYAERLNRSCEMNVVEAYDNIPVKRGNVYVAPAGYQAKVRQQGNELSLSCLAGEKVSGHSPSVNVLYASVAELRVKNKIGIILTGMGRDGAKEMLTLRQRGGYTIGQDEKSSVVYGMPMEAHLLGGVVIQSDLKKIPDILMNYLRKL